MLQELQKEYGVDPQEKMTEEKDEEAEECPHDKGNYLKEFGNVANEDEDALEKETHQTGP